VHSAVELLPPDTQELSCCSDLTFSAGRPGENLKKEKQAADALDSLLLDFLDHQLWYRSRMAAVTDRGRDGIVLNYL